MVCFIQFIFLYCILQPPNFGVSLCSHMDFSLSLILLNDLTHSDSFKWHLEVSNLEIDISQLKPLPWKHLGYPLYYDCSKFHRNVSWYEFLSIYLSIYHLSIYHLSLTIYLFICLFINLFYCLVTQDL